jgi:hypothetical protein
MLDFRYHALSLVAVFLALAIGIVLGVTIGDSLLSQAEQGLRNDLKSDVVNARAQVDDAEQRLRARDRFIERLRPGLASNRLQGRRVAIVSWGPLPGDVEGGIRDAVKAAGGKLDSESQFVRPLTEMEQAIGTDSFTPLSQDEAGLRSLGRRVAASLVRGGELPAALRDLDGDRYSGRYLSADVVAFFQSPPPRDEDAGSKEREDNRGRAFETGLLDGLQSEAAQMVGVEAAGTDPSQIGFYRRESLTSVDSVDLAAGQIALVYALAGADGTFGLKPSALSPLPPADQLGL